MRNLRALVKVKKVQIDGPKMSRLSSIKMLVGLINRQKGSVEITLTGMKMMMLMMLTSVEDTKYFKQIRILILTTLKTKSTGHIPRGRSYLPSNSLKETKVSLHLSSTIRFLTMIELSLIILMIPQIKKKPRNIGQSEGQTTFTMERIG